MNQEEIDRLDNGLTRNIIGIAFEIYNKLGYGYPEKTYQKAFEEKLKTINLPYQRERYCPLNMDDKRIGFFYIDFVIDKRLVVELKARGRMINKDVAQTLQYMKKENIKLGLVLLFAKSGVEIKRLVL
jgi:GxxExxY protein